MNKTQIEWAQNPDGTSGYTWNPITGCLNNCSYCYARRLANTRLKERYLENRNVAPPIQYCGVWDDRHKDPFYPRFWPERLDKPLLHVRRNGAGKGVFTCDMSDLFGIGVPEDWTRKVMEVIKTNNEVNNGDGDRFYLLTKQPQNLIKFSPFPDNCWVGVSATNLEMLKTATIYLAHDVEAKIKYVSLEPLLDWETDHIDKRLLGDTWLKNRVDWVIIGAQTKPYKPPKIEWVQEIVEACDKAGIPVFLKDNLRMAGDVSMQVGYLRQEMPK